MHENTRDEDLMLSYRSGDAAAFEVLYQRHKGSLYRYILRQCDRQYADELFQDVWMKLINARDNYQAKAQFKTWLYHIAHNRIIDHYRRLNVKPVSNHDIQPDELSSQGDQPQQQAQAGEVVTNMINLIRNLPYEQRDVFLLREEAGLSIEQIAQTTGVNTETAKSRLRYALKKLRNELEPYL